MSYPHKATAPIKDEEKGFSTCVHCRRPIKVVPGGDGRIFVHEDGFVVCTRCTATAYVIPREWAHVDLQRSNLTPFLRLCALEKNHSGDHRFEEHEESPYG